MNKTILCASAMLALAATQSQADDKQAHKEKCYGIAKAGKNDCAFRGNSCAGSAKADNEPDAWVYMSKEDCTKMGGNLTPPTQKK